MRGTEKVVVNSKFTGTVVKEVFGELGVGEVGVVYPCVDTSAKPGINGAAEEEEEKVELWKGKKILLSINRFEEKKNIGLAIKAYAGLSLSVRKTTRLVIAGIPASPLSLTLHQHDHPLTTSGGYDPHLLSNTQYHLSLLHLCTTLSLKTATFTQPITALSTALPADTEILFLLSIPSALKRTLLSSASLLVYTPSFEHFGIVPVEAMWAKVPVLAANTGGPLETVVDSQTGWLRPVTDVGAWTEVMALALDGKNAELLAEMGRKGQQRVLSEFSATKMASVLDDVVEELWQQKSRGETEQFRDALLNFGMGCAVLLMGVYVAVMKLS
jgi:alpha-1,3/alpha-1,6-mannosyltransferase